MVDMVLGEKLGTTIVIYMVDERQDKSSFTFIQVQYPHQLYFDIHRMLSSFWVQLLKPSAWKKQNKQKTTKNKKNNFKRDTKWFKFLPSFIEGQ